MAYGLVKLHVIYGLINHMDLDDLAPHSLSHGIVVLSSRFIESNQSIS